MMKREMVTKRIGVAAGLAIIVCLGLPSRAYTRSWVTFDPTWGAGETARLISPISDASQTVVDIKIPGMWRSQTTKNGQTFDILKLPGYATTTDPGKAELPVIRKLVAVPSQSNVALTIVSVDSTILTGYYVYPFQMVAWSEPDTFYYDSLFYSTDSFYPLIISEVGDPALWRDCRVVKLTINPLRYNPVTGELSDVHFTIPPGETVVPEMRLACRLKPVATNLGYEQERVTYNSKDWLEHGIPICTRGGNQWYPKGVSDGVGGAICVWWDTRNDNVYAQRIDKDGNLLWDLNGIPLFANPVPGSPNQLLPAIVSVGNNGAIVVGNMGVNGVKGFHAQKVDSTGSLLWGADGVKVSSLYASEGLSSDNFQITTDGSGGVIVAFAWGGDIYAQRVDAMGNIKWGVDGTKILSPQPNVGDTLVNPSIVGDGSGGAIITGTQYYVVGDVGFRILAQRVDSIGSPLWGTSGVHTGLQDFLFQVGGISYPKMVSDGVGGAIVANATSSFSPTFQDLYAQRIDRDGNLLWGPDGVHIAGDPPDTSYGQQIMSVKEGGEGGAIFCWSEVRPVGADWDWSLEAQRVDTAGNILWAENGTPVSTERGWPFMVVEWDGSIVMAWSHGWPENIYAQKLDSSDGAMLWEPDGLPVIIEPHRNIVSPWGGHRGQLVSSSDGKAIVFFGTDRGGNWDIYAQIIPPPFTGIEETENYELRIMNYELTAYPNPFRKETVIKFTVNGSQFTGKNRQLLTVNCQLKIYDVAGRLVKTLVDERLKPGYHSVDFDSRNLASGIYFARLTAGQFSATRKLVLLQ